MKSRAPRDLQIPFDRVTYRDGQLLASRDLQDDYQTNQRFRRLHTRYLHDTWGVALGFSVDANPGDDFVHVGPGYAIDSSAREILSSDDLAFPVPNAATPTAFLLVAGYQPDSAYRGLPDLSAICFPGGLDPLGERPVLAWRTPANLRPGPDIPLAKALVSQGALVAPLDLSVRRNAERQVRPYIGSGVSEARASRGSARYFALRVDTSDVGFTQIPQYFAKIMQAARIPDEVQTAYANAFGFISNAAETGFTFNIPIAFDAETLTVAWVGLEAVTGCAPIPNFFRYFSLSGLTMITAANLTLKENKL